MLIITMKRGVAITYFMSLMETITKMVSVSANSLRVSKLWLAI